MMLSQYFGAPQCRSLFSFWVFERPALQKKTQAIGYNKIQYNFIAKCPYSCNKNGSDG